MAHSLDAMPVPVPCDAFGPPPNFDTPTESVYDNGMVLGQNDAGEAAWQHTHIRVRLQAPGGVLPFGYDVYGISDLGAPGSVTLWSPLAIDLCGQNELWIKNNSTFDLTVNLAGGTFDFNSNVLILPGKTGVTGNTGGGSVHLVCSPSTASWLVVASHNV